MLFELKSALNAPELEKNPGKPQLARRVFVKATAAVQGARGAERRREPRYQVNDPVDVELIDGSALSGWVRDVSRSGLRLELRTLLGCGALVKITFLNQLVVLGEVRYCQRDGEFFQAGVLIKNAFSTHPVSDIHIRDQQMRLYLAGEGLTVPEVIKLREHLMNCEECRVRYIQSESSSL